MSVKEFSAFIVFTSIIFSLVAIINGFPLNNACFIIGAIVLIALTLVILNNALKNIEKIWLKAIIFTLVLLAETLAIMVLIAGLFMF